jgi:hypothetical protein
LGSVWELACNGNPFEVLGPDDLEVDSMTVQMIPDQPGRAAAFEPLLDNLLPIFSPGWEMPQITDGEHQHYRCEVKRFRLGEAAETERDLTRQHADLLIHGPAHLREARLHGDLSPTHEARSLKARSGDPAACSAPGLL